MILPSRRGRTHKKLEMKSKSSRTGRLRILAICGVAAVLVALGTSPSSSNLLGQVGLFIAGLLAGAFSVGLIYEGDTLSYLVGGAFALVAAIGLFSEGIFPGTSLLSDAVFALAAVIAALLVGGALLDTSHWKVGALSLALGVIALALAYRPLYLGGFAGTGRNVAIALWFILLAIRMFVRAPLHVDAHEVTPRV